MKWWRKAWESAKRAFTPAQEIEESLETLRTARETAEHHVSDIKKELERREKLQGEKA